MPESMKNRNLYPIGTRVHIAQDKFQQRIGTVVEYTEDEERMFVHWDGDYIHIGSCRAFYQEATCTCGAPPRIIGPFMPMELKEVK